MVELNAVLPHQFIWCGEWVCYCPKTRERVVEMLAVIGNETRTAKLVEVFGLLKRRDEAVSVIFNAGDIKTVRILYSTCLQDAIEQGFRFNCDYLDVPKMLMHEQRRLIEVHVQVDKITGETETYLFEEYMVFSFY